MARRRLPPRISRMFSKRLQYSRFKNTAKTTTERDDPTVMSTFEKLFVTPVKVNTSGFGREVSEDQIARKSAGLFPKGFTVKGRTFTEHLIDQIPKTIKNNGIAITTELMNTHTMIESSGVPVDSASKRGMLLWNDSDGSLSIYNKNWFKLTGEIVQPVTASWYGDRGVLVGGQRSPTPHEAIDYWDITTTGNSSDFGDLSQSIRYSSATSNGSTGIFMGGRRGFSNNWSNQIEYITISTPGNSQDFGDLTQTSAYGATAGNGVYGVTNLGSEGSTSYRSNVIDYTTIATPGNSQDFGDLTVHRDQNAAAGNATYVLFTGGTVGAYPTTNVSSTVDYITIASPGNASDFGDLDQTLYGPAACSDTTRAVIGGGYGSGYLNNIQYLTIDTPGNSTDHGDLTQARQDLGACSNGTYGNFAGGSRSGGTSNVIDSITIQTTGNATDHGDLTVYVNQVPSVLAGNP
jgi:hypothetical protein